MANQIINLSNPQELIPESFRGVEVHSEEDLLFLGKENLDAIKQAWRREERAYAETIRTLQAELDVFSGKSIENVQEMASHFEHPEFPRIVVVDDNTEPVDADSLNRKRGATTLNFCGWCKYCTGGEGRIGFEYQLKTHCELLWGSTEEKRLDFNTPCLITGGDQSLLDAMVASHEKLLGEAMAKKRKLETKIKCVMQLAKVAEHKPFIPQKRPIGWIKAGDKVMYFVASRDRNTLPSKADTFVEGTAVGDAFICTDEFIHTGSCLNGYGVRYNISDAEVLLKWEYDYLKRHKFYLEMWLKWARANGARHLHGKFKKAF